MSARYKIQNVSDKRQQRDGSAQCKAEWGHGGSRAPRVDSLEMIHL